MCTILVVLAGCNGIPGGFGGGALGGDTPTETSVDQSATTPTATPDPTGDGVVGDGATANFTGGNFSVARLRAAHRAYFDRANGTTVVSQTTIDFGSGQNVSSNLTLGDLGSSVTVVRVGANGTVFSQPVPTDAPAMDAAAQNGTDAVSLSRVAAYRNASARGTYVNESGAVFVRERGLSDQPSYSFYAADSPFANLSAPENVTDVAFPTLANTTLDYAGTGERDGFSGHVYTAENASALQSDPGNGTNLTAFSLAVVVAPEGNVRYLNLTLGVETATTNSTITIRKAITGINETTVPEPDWLATARESDDSGAFNFSEGNETIFADSKYANDTAVLDGGRVTLNVTMERETFQPVARIESTSRFDNPNLNEWRVGSVARYDYTARNAQEVQITIHYDDSQVPGPESNITAAAWDREEQFFYPLDATVDTESNTVTITLTGEEIEEYERRAIIALDYERYLAFFEDDG